MILITSCSLLISCAEMKQTGQKIGHTTRDITREIGHTTRDITREIGHTTRDAVKTVGKKTKELFTSDETNNDDN